MKDNIQMNSENKQALSLEILIERIHRGDLEAFTILAKKYQNMAFAYAFAMLGNFEKSQDIVQESFLIAYYKMLELETPAAFQGIELERALKLQKYFAQPFFVMAPATKVPGKSVPLAETIKVCNKILNGELDSIPAKYFLYIGGDESLVE